MPTSYLESLQMKMATQNFSELINIKWELPVFTWYSQIVETGVLKWEFKRE